MSSQPVPDEPIVTLQARAIAELEARVAELEGYIRHRDATIDALEQQRQHDQALLGVYQRSRAVRLASLLKRIQRHDGRDAASGRHSGG